MNDTNILGFIINKIKKRSLLIFYIYLLVIDAVIYTSRLCSYFLLTY